MHGPMNIKSGEMYKSWSSSLCYLFPSF